MIAAIYKIQITVNNNRWHDIGSIYKIQVPGTTSTLPSLRKTPLQHHAATTISIGKRTNTQLLLLHFSRETRFCLCVTSSLPQSPQQTGCRAC